MRRRATRALAAFTVAVALYAAAPARAYVLPVWDLLGLTPHYLNLINDYVILAKNIYAVMQRAQTIYQYYQQIDAHYRQLKNWRQNGVWHSLNQLYGDVETVLDQADTLGYSSKRLASLVAETFPEAPVLPTDWLQSYHQRLGRAMTTTKNVMDAIQLVGGMNHDTQLRLREAQAKVQNSDGQTQAIQANSMTLSLGAEESGRAVQAILARANLHAVDAANDLQDEISAAQFTEAWIATPQLPVSDAPSFSAIPSGWPW